MNLITKAINFATEKHDGQTRKQSTIPYILHCLEAGTIATSLTNKESSVDQEVVAAAILHDTVEDAGVQLSELEELFGKRVAYLVRVQSEDKTKTWIERKEHTIEFLSKNLDRDIEVVYLADKLSNVRSIHKEYIEKGDTFWSKFNAPKESQAWYYTSIGDELKQLDKTLEHQEYVRLLGEVFGDDSLKVV